VSGLAGIISLNGQAVEPDILERMARAGRYRAKDGVSSWHSDDAGFVRFRHATTPEAVYETQPFKDEQSGLIICFDGRLDNRQDLLGKLLKSLTYNDNSPDCVLVLELFKHYGKECLNYLVGDYALAIWQPEKRKLFCARSPLGWRPFHWFCDGRVFAWATDIKVIVDGLHLDSTLNEGAIGEFIAMRFTHPTETFWQGIHRLAPGAMLVLEKGHIQTEHWHHGPFPDLSSSSDNELVFKFKELLDQSIVSCMRSSTPVSAHLSGGLDSSSVVCRSVELYHQGKIPSLIRPVSARFPGEIHDETEWSRSVEEHLDLKAMVVTSGQYDWDRARQWCSDTYHLPLRPNVLGTLVASCQGVRSEGNDVLLTGEGGDDWLSGSLSHWPDLLKQMRIRELMGEGLNQGHNRNIFRAFGSTVLRSAGPWISPKLRRQLFQPSYDLSDSIPEWIERDWARQISLRDRWQENEPVFFLKKIAQQQRFARYGLPRHHVNWENVLAYGESQGIEFRHPLHDLRLTHFIMGIPGHMLRRKGEKKYLLREAMLGTLPEKVRNRQTKANFSVPIIEAAIRYFSDHPVDQLLSVKMGWVKRGKIIEILDAYRPCLEAGKAVVWPQLPFGPVWSVLSIELWLRHAIGFK